MPGVPEVCPGRRQGVAQRPGLHEAREGVVDRGVAVGVVVTHDLAETREDLEKEEVGR